MILYNPIMQLKSVLVVAMAALLCVPAMAQKKAKKAAKGKKAVAAATLTPALKSVDGKTFSYALGVAQGQSLKQYLIQREGVDSAYVSYALEGMQANLSETERKQREAYAAGLRIGEICGLKWEDIDTDKGTIAICRTIERIYVVEGEKRHTELIINTPKTPNSSREIPMNKELLAMVKPLKKVVNTEYYVLTNEEKPTEPRTYRNYYHKLMAKLNIPRLKYHGLRHSFATRCIESNCDYKTVSVLLGHANITTTLNLYVHPNLEQKKRCIAKMFKSLGK